MSPMVTSFDFDITGAATLRAGSSLLPNAAPARPALAGLLNLLLISP